MSKATESFDFGSEVSVLLLARREINGVDVTVLERELLLSYSTQPVKKFSKLKCALATPTTRRR